ncbi:MAG TPA: DUF5723 family protein [Saprospiraceae bacterium]|nr:DUF5723 family protein [Saprospiraceae bacterium]HPI05199.1 DUF5723 family protein [Saprospiraceae bacterium]
MNPFARFLVVLPTIFFALFSTHPLSAQEQLGMRTEKFAGLSAAALNPAQTAFMPHPWEINLVGIDAFFENDYGYLSHAGVFKVLGHLDDLAQFGDTLKSTDPLGDMQVGYYNDHRLIRGVFQGRITGPSAAVRIGENHVIGLVTAVRGEASGYRLPEFLRAQRLTDRKRFIEDEVTPIVGGLLTWGEIGLHYSYLQKGDGPTFAFGITPKLLLGLEAGFARSNTSLDFCSTQRDSMAFSRGDWELAMTTGNMHAVTDMGNSGELDMNALHPQVNGFGAGIDVGFVIAMPKYEDASEDENTWRLGVSLVDFGFIHFKRRSEDHTFVFDSLHVISSLDYAKERDPHEILDLGGMNFYGKTEESLQKTSFAAFLPAAVVFQFDYQVLPDFSVGSVWVQRVPFGKFAVKHVNTFSFVPRFERRWISAAAPVSLSDWRSVRVGFSLRMGFLTVGTDNLNSYFIQQQFTGSDVYVGIKVNGWQRSGHSYGMSGKSRRKIKCFGF